MGKSDPARKAAENQNKNSLLPLPEGGVITLPNNGVISSGANEINLKIYFSKDSVIGPNDGPGVGPVSRQDPPKEVTTAINPQDGVPIGPVGPQDPPAVAKKILNISVYF